MRVRNLSGRLYCLALAGLSLWNIGAAFGQTVIHVPQDRPTIQAGIDAASNGDTVLVAPGVYPENIDFKGKGILVTSGASSASGATATVIRGTALAPVVTFQTGEPLTATINGFTLTHRQASGQVSGGDAVAIQNASATISNNIMTGIITCAINAVTFGSLNVTGNSIRDNVLGSSSTADCGVSQGHPPKGSLVSLLTGGDVRFVGNTVSNNTNTPPNSQASGMDFEQLSSVLFQNNVVIGNDVASGMPAINATPNVTVIQNQFLNNRLGAALATLSMNGSSQTVTSNTFAGNYFVGFKYAATAFSISGTSGSGVIKNNIFESDVSSQIYSAISCDIRTGTNYTFSNNDVYIPGAPETYNCSSSPAQQYANLAVDPQFVSRSTGDYHTQPTSPVVASGDVGAPLIPAADFDGKARVVCGTIDMGVYEVRPHPPILLSSSPNPSVGGSAVTFTAKVQGNCNVPTGVLTILDGQTQIAAVTLDTNGSVVFTTAGLFVGTHSIIATYPGDFNFENSTSNTVHQVVTGYPSATSLQVSPDPASAFQSITFTSAVTSLFGSPTGTVSFYAGSNLLATVSLNAAGIASTALDTFGVGTYNITAVYNASVNFAGSTSPVIVENVIGATTNTTASSVPNPSSFGQGVTFTAAVKAPQSTAVPSGTVNFREGSTILGSSTLNATGVAIFTTSNLTVGTHSITADYQGSASDNPSTSNTLLQVVQPITTAVALTGTPNPAALGQTVTLTANTSPIGNATVPAGSITFADQFGSLGTVALTNGQAILTTNNLATGTHNITATFTATGNFAGAASSPLAELIQSFDFSVTLNPASLSLATGRQGQVIVLLQGVGNLPGNVTLQASQIPMYATLGFKPQAVSFTAGGSGSSLLSLDTAQAPHHALLEPPVTHDDHSMLAFAGLFAVPLLFLRRRGFIQALCSLLLIATLLASSGCTNIYYPLNRVAPGTYSIPITATDTTTNITHTATLTLTVTP